MREIKFRVWDFEERRMWTQHEMTEIGGYYYNYGVNSCEDHLGRKYEIMQYIGLKDKNGREIFEKDIIKHHRILEFPDDYHTGEPSQPEIDIIRIGVCSITTKGAIFTGRRTTKDYHEDKIIDNNVKWRGWLTCISQYGEIIGNIMENPGLL